MLVIPCIFNRGFSAAKFLLVPPNEVTDPDSPPSYPEGWGVSKGGARFLHVGRSCSQVAKGV